MGYGCWCFGNATYPQATLNKLKFNSSNPFLVDFDSTSLSCCTNDQVAAINQMIFLEL